MCVTEAAGTMLDLSKNWLSWWIQMSCLRHTVDFRYHWADVQLIHKFNCIKSVDINYTGTVRFTAEVRHPTCCCFTIVGQSLATSWLALHLCVDESIEL